MRVTERGARRARRLGQAGPGLAKPLRQLLQSIDDRRRAVEADPRAAATDPPAPDKTHISGQGGFTGMEAIWNYFYWQALSTNALDDMGHILRLNVLVNDCSGYFNHLAGQEACRSLQAVARPAPAGHQPARADATTPRLGARRPHRPSPRLSHGRARPRLPPGPMRGRRGALTATPLLVGAVTVLVALVAVFISYSANEGLPFVPTYRIKVELPDAAKLVEGNDVRAGGFRVGQVGDIQRPERVNGQVRAIAVLDLKLDKKSSRCPWTRASRCAHGRRSA